MNRKWIQIFKATELQAGAYQITSRDWNSPMPYLSFRSSTLPCKQQGLLSGTASPFPSHQGTGLWEDSDLWVRDSYKWCVQALWQAAHLVTDELVSRRAEPMYLVNDRTAMLIKSMWIVKKSKYGLYTKCPWWIDSSYCALLWFPCIHTNYTCNSKFSLNLFLFTGTLHFQVFANDKVLYSAPEKDLSPYLN